MQKNVYSSSQTFSKEFDYHCKEKVFRRRNKREAWGDRRKKKYEDKLASVKAFIESLPAKDSVITIGKSRKDLSVDLNITKLWKRYESLKETPELQVRYRFFYNIFVNEYNIGFGTPASDVCSTFTIKTAKSDKDKINAITEKKSPQVEGKAVSLFPE